MTSRLSDLFTKHSSDKTTIGYAETYECLFAHLRYKPIKLLEIGIGTLIPGVISSMHGYAGANYKPGASLHAWQEFFVNGQIYGVDIQPDTQFTAPRITTIHADSRNQDEITRKFNEIAAYGFDIIIDDGSHLLSDQVATFSIMFNWLNPQGYYIVEDLGRDCHEPFVNMAKNNVGDLPMFITRQGLCVIRRP